MKKLYTLFFLSAHDFQQSSRAGAVCSPERGDSVKIRIDKKDQSRSQPSRRQFRKLQPAVLFMMICLLACAVSSGGTSKLYPHVPNCFKDAVSLERIANRHRHTERNAARPADPVAEQDGHSSQSSKLIAL
jgi:hypothetical protein